MTQQCPEGHASTAADFCSVCGAEMHPADAVPAAAQPAADAAAPTKCPDCDTPRVTPFQVFCEVCGYNHPPGTPGQGQGVVRVTPRANAPTTAAPAPPAAHPDAPPHPQVRWDVVVKVDPNLYGKPNLDAPADQPMQTFTLFEDENVIGRGGADVRVHVPIVNDPGVSRRQALLLRQPDGGPVLRDLNSANGTQLNGKELVPGADAPVRDGDAIAVGAWTRIAVRAVIQ